MPFYLASTPEIEHSKVCSKLAKLATDNVRFQVVRVLLNAVITLGRFSSASMYPSVDKLTVNHDIG